MPIFRYFQSIVIFALHCILLQSCTTIPTELKNTPITSPGEVLVSHTLREKQVINSNLCDRGHKVDPIIFVDAPSGYGLDDWFNTPRDMMIYMGGACLKGSVSQCQLIVEMMEEWSKAKAARILSDEDDHVKFWNDTLTVNLRVVRPFIGAYSIAKAKVNPPAETDELIRQWMHRTVKRASHLLRGDPMAAQNHAIASSAAWMAYGAMWNDKRAFECGIEKWFVTLSSMREDGSFPLETRRGSRALFYTGRTLSALMSIAEMAKTQGLDLYSHSPSENKTIHKAVQFMLDALGNYDLVFKYARENYNPGPNKDYRYQDVGRDGSTFGWIYPYASRFPNHSNSTRIKKLSEWGLALCGEWIGACSGCLYYPK